MALFLFSAAPAWAATNIYLVDVPDYAWFYGCMGTASGNLMGYWDRHGFPDFYTGTVNSGVAPLNSANVNIVSLWASKAGQDGRSTNSPGHVDDYYLTFESGAGDPFVAAGRPEHSPDCLGDFTGLSQRKWASLAGECDGNIDGFSFVFWDTNGARRVNYAPTNDVGESIRDVPSGLRAWTQFRGGESAVFSQLADFNTNKPAGTGFTFEDLKAEIDAGYPVLLYLQSNQWSRTVGGYTNVNPLIHSMLAYGYYVTTANYVRYRTSWASGSSMLSLWGPQKWQAGLPLRGVIGYHPLPKMKSATLSPEGDIALLWDGPASDLYVNDGVALRTNRVHGYVVQMSTTLDPPAFSPVSSVLLTNTFTVTNCPSPAYFRVELVKP